MRYDKPVFFQRVQPGEYDESTGNYGADTVTEVLKRASVTDSGANTLRLIYGEIRQGSKIIRLQRPYKEAFDRIRIGKKLYSVDMSRYGRVFVVSEVQ